MGLVKTACSVGFFYAACWVGFFFFHVAFSWSGFHPHGLLSGLGWVSLTRIAPQAAFFPHSFLLKLMSPRHELLYVELVSFTWLTHWVSSTQFAKTDFIHTLCSVDSLYGLLLGWFSSTRLAQWVSSVWLKFLLRQVYFFHALARSLCGHQAE